MAGRYYSEQTLKRLWGLSGNECYMVGCPQQIAYPDRNGVLGETAHIRGLNPGSARFDPTYEPVNEFENLIVLCPTHHAVIDDIEPDDWPVDRLEKMKREHEDSSHARSLAGDELRWTVQRVIAVTIREMESARSGFPLGATASGGLAVTPTVDRIQNVADAIHTTPQPGRVDGGDGKAFTIGESLVGGQGVLGGAAAPVTRPAPADSGASWSVDDMITDSEESRLAQEQALRDVQEADRPEQALRDLEESQLESIEIKVADEVPMLVDSYARQHGRVADADELDQLD